ncbi:MAG: BNR repeat-containing protein [Candidatus Brocadiia bacterium]
MSRIWIGIALMSTLACAVGAAGDYAVRASTELGKVWAGHPVGFAFAEHGGALWVGFYDHQRFMVVGRRALDEEEWTLHRTSERVGWDSHNYIAFGFDGEGQLHVAANMHCVPLRYWRTERAGEVTSLAGVHKMTGRNERRCTYPRFLHAADGRLLFMYRDGGSGNGKRLINVYDEKSQAWRRFVDQPLLSGEGKMNAYPTPIRRDDDGVFHMAWVWRDTPDCATNHHLSYARSRDLKTWTTSSGRHVPLPMTIDAAEVVDPVPPGGGLLNSLVRLSFDAQDRPLIAYTRYDEKGYNQLWVARLEEGGWKRYQTTTWEHRWEFKGRGAIGAKIRFSSLRPYGDGSRLIQSVSHPTARSGHRLLDAQSLQPVDGTPRLPRWPRKVRAVEGDFPGLRVRTRTVEHAGATYVLRWETLGAHRDRPRPKDQTPPPSRLVLYELVAQD